MKLQTTVTENNNEIRRYSWLRIVMPFVAICLCLALGRNVEQLFLGWLYFLTRVIPRITVDWPSVTAGMVSVVVFMLAIDRFGRRKFGRTQDFSTTTAQSWTWRTTISVCCALFSLFAAGTAMVGMSHQFVWLWTGRADRSEIITPRDLGWIEQMKDEARRTHAKNNLKQIGLAIHNYHDTYGSLPFGGTMSEDGELRHGWIMAIGPYISFVAPDLDEHQSWRSEANARFYRCQIPDLLNPCQPGPLFDESGFGLAHWAANCHVMPIVATRIESSTATIDRALTMEQESKGRGLSLDQITDGTSSTILVGSVAERFRPWGHPANVRDPAIGINRIPEGFGGPPGWSGAMFLMCDGSVQFLPESTDLSVMKALATPRGGESLNRL